MARSNAAMWVVVVLCFFGAAEAVDAAVYQGTTLLESHQSMTLDLTLNSTTQKADIIFSGRDNKWFSVGFGTTVDAGAYVIVVEGNGGDIEERKLGNHSAGTLLAPSVVEVSDTTDGGVRTVHLRRDLDVGDPDYYAFTAEAQELDLIWAHGMGASLGFHEHRGATTITLTAIPEPSIGASMVVLLAGAWWRRTKWC